MSSETRTEVSEVEVSPEDIAKVQELQAEYLRTTGQVGQVEIEITVTSKRLEDLQVLKKELLDTYINLGKKEEELVSAMNEKYGDGVLDISTGKLLKD